MIVDSHCHLNFKSQDIDEVINNALASDVKVLLNIATKYIEFKAIMETSDKYENVFYTLGIHPHEANETTTSIINEIYNNADSKKLIGIGETGLDFYYNNSEKSSQIKSLEMHIELSQEVNLPLIIHMRNAENEILDIFTKKMKEKIFNGVIHCFTGSQKFADEMVGLGFYISASGIITFKNSDELRRVFITIPDDRLLVETDSPYLSPEPLRGVTNQPSHIIHTVNKLAAIRNDNFDLICKKTSNNFDTLFNTRVS